MIAILKKISLGMMVVATTASFSAQKIDAKAKTILDAVATNYKSKDNVYFKFVYGTGTGKKVTKTEPGIFYSAKDLYKLKIMGTEQIFDGNKIYNISAEDQEITVAKPTGSEQMFSPLTYIEQYKKGYNVKYVGKLNVNGVNSDYIKLTPVKNNGIKEVNLFVNAAKKQIVKIEQFSNDNAVSVIAINDYKENQKLSSTMFTFDKDQYKNYFVTEL
ncbi:MULTISPECIES: outer membrane lipoprotein carrier protein LolA [unclassified Kaistella]|uniref:LolA family protein n=1 Tax=unclassified Kaistella TaxID=2762626 RepID=UPI0027344B16|nr:MULTISPECIES: outer membrane lipoprotein carrier protein LolA [unclassified Kaistella]MDP2453998.1 outer membrane lipoprotein carrier protein LolA [Kaistella sp. SH11-4b]MDP2457055.1 outer membrane lipoprotein carrier protein LolA [Kaistella sp. SH40-3]MDP2459812.1 outer membrane lipoprotein carrier protein LolA [Kaistella sp. SH19-2b]